MIKYDTVTQMYSLKGDMLLLNAMVKKKDSAAAREALQASRHHNLSFLPHKSAPVPSPVMTSVCFFIVLFSESASLFVTVCLPLTDLAVSGARHTRSPLKAATLEASRQVLSVRTCSPLRAHFYWIPIVLSRVSFSRGFPLLFFFFLAFSSLPRVFLCKRDCFRHCRRRPLSLAGFSELAFCFGQQIWSGGTVRDDIS